MKESRLRDVAKESCGRCHAKRGKPCQNYKGQRKPTCFVVIGCNHCKAQVGRCRHRGRVLIQRDLFGPMSPAWTPRSALPATGTTGDDNRRTVK